MLRTLSIRNVVLIERLDLHFEGGLSALTGETGSGKSILLDSLGLATGMRADADLIRQGQSQSTVTAEFDTPDNPMVRSLLEDQGVETDGAIILRRVVKQDGRSRAFVNDQPVSIGFLRQIGGYLVEVHGQMEVHGLLDPATHGSYVDSFGKLGPQLGHVSECYLLWQSAETALKRAIKDLETAKKDEEFLRHAVDELISMDPKENEEEELAQTRVVMMHGEHLVQSLNEAFEDLNSGEGVESSLRSALQKLERCRDKAGGKLDAATNALDRALVEFIDGLSELETAAGSIDMDPSQLEQVEDRLFALRALARKHGVEVAGLPALRNQFEATLKGLNSGSENLEELRHEAQKARTSYVAAAQLLTIGRVKAAQAIDQAVQAELPPLKLEAAIFRSHIEALAESDWGASGCERMTFEVQTNPNTAMGPLHKIASGGELARIMLALKVVLADADSVPSIVFDEVDAGIGGAAAAAVGDRLSRLSEDLQVMAVTHSPQVAAMANQQWRITKSGDSDTTQTSVQALDPDARKEEIARMLAGAEVTDAARAAAGQLLDGENSGKTA